MITTCTAACPCLDAQFQEKAFAVSTDTNYMLAQRERERERELCMTRYKSWDIDHDFA
jgi:hypothetical protein